MVRRFIATSILAIGLLFLTGTTALAVIGGYGGSQLPCDEEKKKAGLCSIAIEGFLAGLGKKLVASGVAFLVTLDLQAGNVYCVNPKGQVSNGTSFGPAMIESGATVDPKQVTGKGNALVDVIVHDEQLLDAVAPGFTCNNNWFPAVLVKEMQVFGEQFDSCQIGTNGDLVGTCTLNDKLVKQCSSISGTPIAPWDDGSASLVWTAFDYNCETVCHEKPTAEEEAAGVPKCSTLGL